MPYDHQNIEKKWQKFWEENRIFKTQTSPHPLTPSPSEKGDGTGNSLSFRRGLGGGRKKYILDMFPYPSGAGLHVGHPKGYTATDIVSRYYHAKGYNVLHPMGFDAFGLPAENYAIKTGTHPAITTAENIATFTEQMKNLGFSYDWDRMVDTTDPEYYRWTQWIFLKLFERGLAYEQDLPINYCPSCKTGLANEEVLSDNTCDRCGTRVERRPIRQWVLRITEYAERLIEDLDGLDWPEGIKEMQRNWIGKSEGCEFRLMKKVEGKPTALILHGWDDEENRTEWHWMSSAKTELEKIGYDVIMEQLPNNNAPDLEKQLAFLEQYKDRLDEHSVIIGHSMGGFLGMHFVERLGKKINKLICVAPVFNGLIDYVDWSQQATGWDIGSVSMRQSYNPEKIKKNLNTWNVFLSENDWGIDYVLAKKHFEEIGGIDIISVPNAGHFTREDGYSTFPSLLESLDHIRVYTTRVDTVYSMAFAVVAPDHPSVDTFITPEQRSACQSYIDGVKGKSDLDRTNDGKEKTGVWTGSYVINPYNGESVPLWIGDFVLGSYGTGAVFGDAHDERDFIFAKRYGIPLKQSIAPKFSFKGGIEPRSDKEYVQRDAVDAIIENSEGKILLLKEERGIHFPGGGMDGEDELVALRREIIEETGYTDFEIGKEIISDCYSAFKKSLDKNAYGKCVFYSVKLLSENRVKSEVEEGLHEMYWETKENVSKHLTWDNHRFAWEQYLSPFSIIDDGVLINSGEYDGLSSADARRVLTEKAETEGFGAKKVNYKLRDWLFSRQRYWGEPIPLIHISHEDYANLPRIDKLEDVEVGVASILSSRRDPFQNQVGENDSQNLLSEGKSDFSASLRNDKNTRDDGSRESLVIDGQIFSDIYDGINGKIIIDHRLPLTLPEVEKYEPAGDGQSPLATVPDWVNVKLADNLNGKRETNTMPQWGGSCWYYLRYMDNKNSDALASQDALDYWGTVDEYVGGAEHAVLHLLYARFWHKVLYDAGVVPTKEPFQKLTNVGMILAYAYERADGGLVAVDLVEERDGRFFEKETGKEVKQVVAKMSKSLKNVVNPNDIVREYGADTLRLYEMNMAGFTDTAPWNPEAITGVRRFLDKAYVTCVDGKNIAKDDMKAMKLLHKTIKKVGEDIVGYKFNTAISSLMILLNEGVPTDVEFATEWKEKFAILLHPFAPHMAEELYSQLAVISNQGSEKIMENDSTLQTANCKLQTERSIYFANWPDYDEFMLVDDEVTIAVQVNGKLRGTLTCFNGVAQEEVSLLAHEQPEIAKWLEGKTLVKEIFIPNKMLSIVVKD